MKWSGAMKLLDSFISQFSGRAQDHGLPVPFPTLTLNIEVIHVTTSGGEKSWNGHDRFGK